MKRSMLLLAAALAGWLLTTAPAEASEVGASRLCSKRAQPADVTRLRVSGHSCATGARIARGWVRRRGCDPDVPFIDRRCLVSGWRCTASRVAIVTTRTVSCSRRSARVRFLHREQ